MNPPRNLEIHEFFLPVKIIQSSDGRGKTRAIQCGAWNKKIGNKDRVEVINDVLKIIGGNASKAGNAVDSPRGDPNDFSDTFRPREPRYITARPGIRCRFLRTATFLSMHERAYGVDDRRIYSNTMT